jgi:hypothetical protein
VRFVLARCSVESLAGAAGGSFAVDVGGAMMVLCVNTTGDRQPTKKDAYDDDEMLILELANPFIGLLFVPSLVQPLFLSFFITPIKE